MYSYVCVLSTNDYLDGVLVLNENLKQLRSKYQLLCVVNENIDTETRNTLKNFDIPYKEMKSLNMCDIDDSFRWKFTFDKLNVFDLTEFKKIVYLDLDFLILENIDNLFEIDKFAMVSDNRTDEEYFCSALMVIKPDKENYEGLISLIKHKHITEGMGDQDIINEYFDDIYVIPIEYNFIKGIELSLIDDFDLIKNSIVSKYICKDYYISEEPKIIHYYGDVKPFMINKEFDDKYCHLYFYYLELIRRKKL